MEQNEFKYLTTLNVIKKEENFHYVNIIMVAHIDDEKASQIVNLDAKVCKEWEWINWSEIVKREDLYHTFYCLFESGFTEYDYIVK